MTNLYAAIEKLEYHARTARRAVAQYTNDIEVHAAETTLDGFSAIDVDNCLRLIDAHNCELDSFNSALDILKMVVVNKGIK